MHKNPFPQEVGRAKVLYTLNIGNYCPEICAMTYPQFQAYAKKIGADFYVITERKFDHNDMEYEKLQIHTLARKQKREWAIYIDSDALIHTDLFDIIAYLPKDTVMHHGSDSADLRWHLDENFLRDGRFISSCNWFTIASHWCFDLWRPPEDLTQTQVVERILPTPYELQHGVTAEHLVSDYILSRNISRYGLKFTTFIDMLKKMNRFEGSQYAWHEYTLTIREKIATMRKVLDSWEHYALHGSRATLVNLPSPNPETLQKPG